MTPEAPLERTEAGLAWAEHAFVGAGDGPCAIRAVGTRLQDDVVYPAAEFAQAHGAAVATETRDPDEAYTNLEDDVDVPYQAGWLPG